MKQFAKACSFAAVFLLSSAAFSENQGAEQRRRVVSPASSIQHREDRGAYAQGFIYARPSRGRPDQGLWRTQELKLIVGNFQDDTKYAGNTLHVSTKSIDVLRKIDELDPDTHFIFQYWTSYPFHWNMERTSVMVTGFTDAKNPEDFPRSGLPYEMEITGGKQGSYTQQAVTSGRIVDVFRMGTYILNRPICSFVLDQGGSRRADSGAVANEVTFSVYSEEGCKYVESIAAYGLELRVTYSIAWLTIDPYDHFAHKITVDKIPGLTPAHSSSLVNRSLSEQSRRLLEDPQFRKELDELVNQAHKRIFGN